MEGQRGVRGGPQDELRRTDDGGVDEGLWKGAGENQPKRRRQRELAELGRVKLTVSSFK